MEPQRLECHVTVALGVTECGKVAPGFLRHRARLYQGPSSPVWDFGGQYFHVLRSLPFVRTRGRKRGHLQTQDVSGGNHRDIFRLDNPTC